MNYRNRKHQIVQRVPVTPEERALLQQKMAQLGTKNFSPYARKMLIDGYIVHMDTSGGAGTDMAITKIHPIKVNLKAALDYI